MRLIKISAPEGSGERVAKIAFAVEIESVSRSQQSSNHRARGVFLPEHGDDDRRPARCLHVDRRGKRRA